MFSAVIKCLIFLLLTVYKISGDASTRNVLLIIADDGGFEMGTYRNKICQTPNLDKLAKKSLIFNNAYTSVSSCSPSLSEVGNTGPKTNKVTLQVYSRSAILTGMPAHQNGIYGLHQGVHHFSSFDKIKSLPQILNKNGVRTGIIGKKHVGPKSVYNFDYEQTEENNSILQVGRNITHMKLLAREFLQNSSNSPFFLYIGFHDPHRCGHTNPEFGQFCEKFGNGDVGMGTIPDWAPIYYQWDEIQLPYFVPDTEIARRDVAAQYTTISRLDQGVGLIIDELKNAGKLDSTLIIYSSDNGIPFPNGRTNLYDSGMAEPMFIASPEPEHRKNEVTYSLTSLLDITPTIMDWFNIKEENRPILTGRSLLPLLQSEPKNVTSEAVFASHNLHEITMYYPMRAIRTHRYKLIHNLNSKAAFPIDQDFYLSPTFQEILNITKSNQPLPWTKTLQSYYFRSEWELYDLKHDPEELKNLANKNSVEDVFQQLKEQLFNWQLKTNDPWICSPHAVLEDKGAYKNNPQCMDLYNFEL